MEDDYDVYMPQKISHVFRWHDPLCEGAYSFGENGYLSMDGSRGRIICGRKISPALEGAADGIELCFRVVLGRSYEVRLCDPDGDAVVVCRLEPEGWFRFFSAEGGWHTVRPYLTYAYGIPVPDPEMRADLHIRESDETTIRFGGFALGDAAERGLRFSVNGEEEEHVTAVHGTGREIASMEIRTPDVAPGTVFRLRHFKHFRGEKVVEEDRFESHWKPVVPPEEGYAYDHISEIRLFPKDYRWLQTVTQYGWAKLRFPRIVAGRLSYTLMTPDIGREAALLLEERHPTIEQGCRAHTGIVRNRFFFAGPEKKPSRTAGREVYQDRLFYVEEPVPEANRDYRFTVEWDPRGYRISVDGKQLSVDGKESFPFEMAEKPYSGIDTLTLHPGTFGTRPSLLQKEAGIEPPSALPDPHVAYWGDFEIEED